MRKYHRYTVVSRGGAAVAIAPEVHAAVAAAERSPSVAANAVTISYEKNDEWAVGWVGYEMCTGKPPFDGEPPYTQTDRARLLRPAAGDLGGVAWRTVQRVLDGLTRVSASERLSAESAYLSMLETFAAEDEGG